MMNGTSDPLPSLPRPRRGNRFRHQPRHVPGRRRRRLCAAVAAGAKLVRFGADCYAYGLLTLGCIDLVVEASLKPYDFSAMLPIVEGAGGIATDWQGAPLTIASDGRVVVAGDRRAHEQALALLAA